MRAFSSNRLVGVALAILANTCFAATNLMSSAYPSLGGLYLWRGAGSAGVLMLRRGTPSWRGVTLGSVHAAHMLTFLLSVRIGPAWLAPAVLGGVPAVLWFWARQHSAVVNGAVVAMAMAAVTFSWGADGSIAPAAAGCAITAAALVAVRMHYASMWVGSYDPNFSLLVAYGIQTAIGCGVFIFGGDVTLVLWLAAGMVVTGVVGHLALYETASHCSPSIAAALAPLSVVLTAAGVAFLGGQTPTLRQGAAAVVWMGAGVVVALFAQNHQIQQTARTR